VLWAFANIALNQLLATGKGRGIRKVTTKEEKEKEKRGLP
jgi:hypothetical protein